MDNDEVKERRWANVRVSRVARRTNRVVGREDVCVSCNDDEPNDRLDCVEVDERKRLETHNQKGCARTATSLGPTVRTESGLRRRGAWGVPRVFRGCLERGARGTVECGVSAHRAL